MSARGRHSDATRRLGDARRPRRRIPAPGFVAANAASLDLRSARVSVCRDEVSLARDPHVRLGTFRSLAAGRLASHRSPRFPIAVRRGATGRDQHGPHRPRTRLCRHASHPHGVAVTPRGVSLIGSQDFDAPRKRARPPGRRSIEAAATSPGARRSRRARSAALAASASGSRANFRPRLCCLSGEHPGRAAAPRIV